MSLSNELSFKAIGHTVTKEKAGRNILARVKAQVAIFNLETLNMQIMREFMHIFNLKITLNLCI